MPKTNMLLNWYNWRELAGTRHAKRIAAQRSATQRLWKRRLTANCICDEFHAFIKINQIKCDFNNG